MTNGEDDVIEEFAAPDLESDASVDISTKALPRAIEIVVISKAVSPDIVRLADQAGAWGSARRQAVADGRVVITAIPPPSNTNLALLPVVKRSAPAASEPEIEVPVEEPEPPVADPEPPAADPDEPVEDPAEPPVVEPEPPVEEPVEPPTVEDPIEEPVEPPTVEDPIEEPTEPTPEPDEPPVVEPEPDTPTAPPAPAQVDGRVPPPAGGPTAAQWNALRKCESTHSYHAISPSGLYRGAYQFSQQTWDWVAGIHQPHLVGIDPIDADPAWQDIMAYTLYAMRGWDQWPICGKNLL